MEQTLKSNLGSFWKYFVLGIIFTLRLSQVLIVGKVYHCGLHNFLVSLKYSSIGCGVPIGNLYNLKSREDDRSFRL